MTRVYATVIALGLAMSSVAARADEHRTPVVVRVYNVPTQPALDNEVLASAAALLAHAGVDVIWVRCFTRPRPEETCAPAIEPPDLGIVILNSPPAPQGRGADAALGEAYLAEDGSGVLANIFGDRVACMATSAGAHVGTLLGRVIAHELGHLLMGTSTHRGAGLMRAHWTSTELHQAPASVWAFTSADAADIRTGLDARTFAARRARGTRR